MCVSKREKGSQAATELRSVDSRLQPAARARDAVCSRHTSTCTARVEQAGPDPRLVRDGQSVESQTKPDEEGRLVWA